LLYFLLFESQGWDCYNFIRKFPTELPLKIKSSCLNNQVEYKVFMTGLESLESLGRKL